MYGILSRLRHDELGDLATTSKRWSSLVTKGKEIASSRLMSQIRAWREDILVELEGPDPEQVISSLKFWLEPGQIIARVGEYVSDPLVQYLHNQWTPEAILREIRMKLDGIYSLIQEDDEYFDEDEFQQQLSEAYADFKRLASESGLTLPIIRQALLLYPRELEDTLLSQENLEYDEALYDVPAGASGIARDILTLETIIDVGNSGTSDTERRRRMQREWEQRGNDPIMWVDESNSVEKTLDNLLMQVRENNDILPVHKMLGMQREYLEGIVTL